MPLNYPYSPSPADQFVGALTAGRRISLTDPETGGSAGTAGIRRLSAGAAAATEGAGGSAAGYEAAVAAAPTPADAEVSLGGAGSLVDLASGADKLYDAVTKGPDWLRQGGNLLDAFQGGSLDAALDLGVGATSRAVPIAAEFGPAGPGAELFGSLGVPEGATAAGSTAAAGGEAAFSASQIAANPMVATLPLALFAGFTAAAFGLRGLAASQRAKSQRELAETIGAAEAGPGEMRDRLLLSAAQRAGSDQVGGGYAGSSAGDIARMAERIGATNIAELFGSGGWQNEMGHLGQTVEGFSRRWREQLRLGAQADGGGGGGSGGGGDGGY